MDMGKTQMTQGISQECPHFLSLGLNFLREDWRGPGPAVLRCRSHLLCLPALLVLPSSVIPQA